MKKRPLTALSLASMVLAGSLGGAQAAQTLLESYELAVERDPQLAAARWQRQAQQERIDQARSLFLPNIGLEGEAARTDVETDSMAGTESLDYDSTSYGVALTQPLFRAESFIVYRQAKTLVDQAEIELALARQALALRVSEAYFAVLDAQRALETFDAELKAIEQQLRRAQRAFEVGTGTITDVNDARARYDIVVAERLQALNQLRVARERLQRITDTAADELADVGPDFEPVAPEPASAELWAELAEEKNLQVLLAAYAYDLAREEVARQRAQRYPKVDLVASYGRSSPAQNLITLDPDSDATQSRIGVNVTMPIYTGGAISSQIDEAQYSRAAALEQVRDARLEAAITAESEFLELASSLERIRALQQALKSIQLNEESTRRGVELGLRTTLDLLDIQRELFAAERNLASARYAYLLNYLQLQAAIGQAVEPEAVAAVNQFLVDEDPPALEEPE